MIKTYPDEFLTRVLPECKTPVKQDIVDLLMDVVTDTQCLGLAANQVGIPHRIIVVLKRLMVNPMILKVGDTTAVVEETCLSIPDKVFQVERHEQILIQWQTPDLKKTKTQNWMGGFAYVAQHEIDHLNGILINEKVLSES